MYTNYKQFRNLHHHIHLTKNLAQTISRIISEKEKDNYVCTVVAVNIPEHEALVFHSPLDNYRPWGGGLNALNGSEIQAINEKYGRYCLETIPEKIHLFFVVMKSDELETFSKLSFKDINKAEKTLQSHSVICESYISLLIPKTLTKKFPYLKDFFNFLNRLSVETGKITFDNDVLENAMKKVCC